MIRNTRPFRRAKLTLAVQTGISVLAMGALGVAMPAYAQDEGTLEEVVVMGQRASLRSAQELKRSSEVVVDSITAQDIGALPDRSVTETLQRIPGVAITRFSNGRDPDHFAVEGSGVVVRGLTYVRSEVNGRDAFTANNGRGLSFADVPAELLGGVDVFKSPTADRVEGGIAGSVNLRTRKPFDSTGRQLAFSLEANYGDFIGKTEPTGAFLFSDIWDTDVGQVGALFSVVNSRLKSRADRLQISNFTDREVWNVGGESLFTCTHTNLGQIPCDSSYSLTADDVAASDKSSVYFPRGAVAGSQEFDRERRGFASALQWRSNDESMEATFQFMRSDSREAWTERVVEIATDNVNANASDFRQGTSDACAYADDCIADSRPLPGTTFNYDQNNVFDNGYITGATGWRDDQWSGSPSQVPIYGLQSNNIRRDDASRYVTDDYSFNFRWYASENLAMDFDYQRVDSNVTVKDAGLWFSSYQDVYIDMNGSDPATVQFQSPQEICPDGNWGNTCVEYASGNHPDYSDPYNSFYRSAMDHLEESDGKSDAFRIDADYQFDDGGWIDSVKVGYRHAERDQTARFSTYNWGVLSEQWGGGGPVWLDDVVDGSGSNTYEHVNFGEFLKGEAPNPLTDQGRLFYAHNTLENYGQYVNLAERVGERWRPGNHWLGLANRDGVLPGTPYLPGEVNPVLEENNAFYISMRFSNDFDNGWNLSGNVGLRYTETDRRSGGYQQFNIAQLSTAQECFDQLNPLPGDILREPSAFCSLDATTQQQARDFGNGDLRQFNANLTYDYLLPSINLKLDVGEGLQFRAAYFKGVSPPDFGLTRAYYNVALQTQAADIDAGGGRPVARFNAGNPYLLPVEADNFDLTAEWYFSEVGQLTLSLFYKELENIRTNDIRREALTNNGATFDGIITTPINSKDVGKIHGLELTYQQTFDFLPGWMSGFGVNANYTYIESSNVPQSTLSETDPDVSAGRQTTVDIGRLPLEGLSKHNINFTPFYEKGKFSARLAYSWRSDFLLTIRDVIVPFQPIMQESTGQLDASFFYQISENLKLGVQGVNLTETIQETSAIINNDLQTAPRSWFINDSRWVLSLRGSF